jgi:site-specific recombinase XerD
VFLSNQGTALSLRSINYVIEGVAKRAGVENPNPRLQHLNPHIFRHSIARFLKSKGFTAEWIQNFLGHQSYKTTMDMYDTISIDEMQEVAVKIRTPQDLVAQRLLEAVTALGRHSRATASNVSAWAAFSALLAA